LNEDDVIVCGHTRYKAAQKLGLDTVGDPGCLSLFGRDAGRRRLLADHLTSEYRVKTERRGRTVDEWKRRVSGFDNHWLDCLVRSAVAAAMSRP